MRRIVLEFENAFDGVLRNSERIVLERLFSDLFLNVESPKPCPGMLLIRSSAIIEQCFGGITTRLWDDPFEWTLAESFLRKEQVLDYFGDVEKVVAEGFA